MLNQNNLLSIIIGGIIGYIIGLSLTTFNFQIFNPLGWAFIGALGGLAVSLRLIRI